MDSHAGLQTRTSLHFIPRLGRRPWRLTLAVAVATALAACGSEGPDTAGTVSEPSRPSTSSAPDAAPSGAISLELAWEGLDSPVALAGPPGDTRVFIVEQPGRIKVAEAAGTPPEEWVDLTEEVGSEGDEQGLLGLAFHPDFAANGRLYVDYTDKKGDTQIVELVVDPGGGTSPAEIRSRRTLLDIPQPYENHNGGHLAFGPDGRLWIGTGDGGSGSDPENRAQDDSELLGKMLRLDVDSASVQTWAKGLRNPWRYAFDRETGDLWIADVGQDAQEEIDVVRADEVSSEKGPNFGWSAFEGELRHNEDVDVDSPTRPVAVYDRDDPAGGGCSVTGGYVYRGPSIPGLDGKYVFGDYCSGIIWTLDAASPGAAARLSDAPEGMAITSFGEDAQGRLFVLDRSGDVYVFGTSEE